MQTKTIGSTFLLSLLSLLPALCLAQTTGTARRDQSNTYASGKTQSFLGVVDAGSATRTAPIQKGTSLPGTCTVGDLYNKTDATAGANLYGCTATNTWTVETGGGGGVPTAGDCITVVGSQVNVDPTCAATLAGSNSYTNTNDFSAATLRNTIGTGVPSTGCTASGHVGKLYTRSDTQAANASVYGCHQTGVGTYAWELIQGSAATVKIALATSHSSGPFSPADSTTYYWNPQGTGFTASCLTSYGNLYSLVSPVTGTVTDLFVSTHNQGTTGTGESVTYTLQKECVDTTLTTTGVTNAESPAIVSDSAHTVSITKGQRLNLKIVTPAWATNPTNVSWAWSVSITE